MGRLVCRYVKEEMERERLGLDELAIPKVGGGRTSRMRLDPYLESARFQPLEPIKFEEGFHYIETFRLKSNRKLFEL
jgi:hypothetical protein